MKFKIAYFIALGLLVNVDNMQACFYCCCTEESKIKEQPTATNNSLPTGSVVQPIVKIVKLPDGKPDIAMRFVNIKENKAPNIGTEPDMKVVKVNGQPYQAQNNAKK